MGTCGLFVDRRFLVDCILSWCIKNTFPYFAVGSGVSNLVYAAWSDIHAFIRPAVSRSLLHVSAVTAWTVRHDHDPSRAALHRKASRLRFRRVLRNPRVYREASCYTNVVSQAAKPQHFVWRVYSIWNMAYLSSSRSVWRCRGGTAVYIHRAPPPFTKLADLVLNTSASARWAPIQIHTERRGVISGQVGEPPMCVSAAVKRVCGCLRARVMKV